MLVEAHEFACMPDNMPAPTSKQATASSLPAASTPKISLAAGFGAGYPAPGTPRASAS